MTKGNLRPLLVASILLALVTINCGLVQPFIDRISARTGSESSSVEGTRRRQPTPRPTFTPTPAYTDTPTYTPTPTITPVPTETPTPVATDTPPPTNTPLPTDTPPPTDPPRPAAPQPTDTPAPPAATPTPDFPFAVGEQGNREFQKTTYNGIVVFVAAVDPNNIPIGGLKVVGVNTASGEQKESPPTDYSWSSPNCLGCSYVKVGNVKFEPGPFTDATWEIYLADSGGTQLSPKVPLSYSSSADTWVWDFILFKRK